MDLFSFFLVIRWLFYLWLLGWLVLPLLRRFFVHLPDGGLAAGRILTIALLSLAVYWGAALHLVPMTLAPLWFIGAPLLCGYIALRRPAARHEFFAWVKTHRRALLTSDVIFLVAFVFFLWVRSRHPEINDLEKPMDAALMGSLARAHFLPAENPWFSGVPLTSYYHFGPLMGALLARTLATPNSLAYNVVQPAFCALFIAPLWSLCAALTGSLRHGLVAMILVALLGHFEPVRQWLRPLPAAQSNLFRLDWWSTSRVIPDVDVGQSLSTVSGYPWITIDQHPFFAISEYPLFTMAIGDAHAHFFALVLAVLTFCVCHALFYLPSLHHRRIALLTLGLLLGILVMTNTWDVPLYGVLVLLCAGCTLRFERRATDAVSPSRLPLALEIWLLPLASLTAWPYLHRYRAPASGVAGELWSPLGLAFWLFWGGFVVLWLAVLAAPPRATLTRPLLLLLLIIVLFIKPYMALATVLALLALTVVDRFTLLWQPREHDRAVAFKTVLAVVGLLALLAPMLFYLKAFFGGALRHQDTVFKFGLQAWLLFGTAAACSAVTVWATIPRKTWRWGSAILFAVLWTVPLLCAVNVIWTRTVLYAPRERDGSFVMSLNGARHLPLEDQLALEWLRTHAQEGEAVLEAVGQNERGEMGGDFTEVGRVSALTGVPTPVGWPQHVWFWGGDMDQIRQRWEIVRRIYSWPNDATAIADLRVLGVRYVFVGDLERRTYDPHALIRLRAALNVVYENRDTFIAGVPTPPLK
ncbi:MAG: DUF2298 domain-containing protein [Armatimonadota bacterium]|nr:DUF2298 domain-containing protein [Armatimonadota bacterium]